jgi:hypothetical protein
MAQVAEYLPNNHKAQSSNTITTKKQTNKKRMGELT